MAVTNFKRVRHRWFGAGAMVAVVASAAVMTNDSSRFRKSSSDQVKLVRQFVHYATTGPRTLMIRAPRDVRMAARDPVFAAHADASWRLVGTVSNVQDEMLHIEWFDHGWIPDASYDWEYFESPDSLQWVASVLLPEEKQALLAESLKVRFKLYRDGLLRDMEPLVVATVRDVLPIVQERLRDSLRKHQPRIEALSVRYQKELFQDRIMPRIKSDVLPIVKHRSLPLSETIGQELFEKASIWRFTWRYLYDVSPLPQRDLVRREFERFIENDAIPTLEAHADEILQAVKNMATDLAENQNLQALLRESSSDLYQDPELRSILTDVFHDLFADPEPLREALRKNWESDLGQRVSDQLNDMLEPWLRSMGEELFGTPQEGLTPELVRILRTQILAKDRRWIVARVTVDPQAAFPESDQIEIQRGLQTPRFPMLIEGHRSNPSHSRSSQQVDSLHGDSHRN